VVTSERGRGEGKGLDKIASRNPTVAGLPREMICHTLTVVASDLTVYEFSFPCTYVGW
jgi:hypothetical protein